MKKILKVVLIMIVLLVSAKVYAVENEIQSIILDTNKFDVIDNDEAKGYLGGQNLEDLNTYIKVSTDNELIYCSDANKLMYWQKGEKKFDQCKYITGKNSKIISYIMEYGYSGKKTDKYTVTKYLTGDTRKDYYITQSAIWYHATWDNRERKPWMNSDTFNRTNRTINGQTNDIIEKIMNLINDAEKASDGAKITINTNNTKLSITEDKKYYISDEITLVGTYLNSDITTTISGIDGAFVTTDKTSTTGATTFLNESKVYIKVPTEKITKEQSTITLNVSSTTYLGDNTIIECETKDDDPENDVQEIITYAKKNTKINNKINFSINKYNVKISKKDITNNKEIEGATIIIKNSSGNEIDKWVSEKKSKKISLDPGNYILEETIAPDGYIKNTNKIKFTVQEDGKVLVDGKEVTEVIITNEPITITVSKRSITGSDELKDAKLKITDKDGNTVKDVLGNKLEWTSGDKPKTFHLKKGEYILSETIAPEGYELSEKTIKFTIKENGKVLIDGKEIKDNLIIFKNTPEPVEVETGDTMIYIAALLCLSSLGISIYFITKRKEL